MEVNIRYAGCVNWMKRRGMNGGFVDSIHWVGVLLVLQERKMPVLMMYFTADGDGCRK